MPAVRTLPAGARCGRPRRRRLHLPGAGRGDAPFVRGHLRGVASVSRALSAPWGCGRGDLVALVIGDAEAVSDDAVRRVDRRRDPRVAVSAGDDQRSAAVSRRNRRHPAVVPARAPSSRRAGLQPHFDALRAICPELSLRGGARGAPRAGLRTAAARLAPTTSPSSSSPRGRRRRPRASSSRIAICRRTSRRSAGRRASASSPSDRRRQLAADASRHGARRHGDRRRLQRPVGGAADAAGVRQAAGRLAARHLAAIAARSASRRTLRTIWPCAASRIATWRAWICRAGASPAAARSRFTRQRSRRSPTSFASVGFRETSFLPSYGLAEHVLAATFRRADARPGSSTSRPTM